MTVDSYAYLPPNFEHSLECGAATLAVFERRYDSLENHVTEQIGGSTDQQQARLLNLESFCLHHCNMTSISI
ncbi:hypothetical protein NC653_001676 [Populus alba x Populus x berolinensis]|uniref:Uncharacterized protein n=1 Tax=Populus alba x Populus x berolinensis TaxID=444605 RepID=A0AAD6RM28_9ROSI|nr:hypothetical protein NC653_001676 [Populus alba x Populus x berolinensis]